MQASLPVLSGARVFAEEVNRLVTDQLSSMLLTPVAEAGENLESEGVDPARFDAVWSWAYRHAEEKIEAQSPEDLAKGCARLIEMEEEARRMGEMMRHMALPAS